MCSRQSCSGASRSPAGAARFSAFCSGCYLSVLSNGLIQININPYFQKVAVGIALISAAGLDILYQRLDRVRVPEEPRDAIPGSAASDDAERTPL